MTLVYYSIVWEHILYNECQIMVVIYIDYDRLKYYTSNKMILYL
jgi:hypothetical protein